MLQKLITENVVANVPPELAKFVGVDGELIFDPVTNSFYVYNSTQNSLNRMGLAGATGPTGPSRTDGHCYRPCWIDNSFWYVGCQFDDFSGRRSGAGLECRRREMGGRADYCPRLDAFHGNPELRHSDHHSRLETSGYSIGGLGAASYRRVAAGPATAYRTQSLDGAWWEIDEYQIDPAMVGALVNGKIFNDMVVGAENLSLATFSSNAHTFTSADVGGQIATITRWLARPTRRLRRLPPSTGPIRSPSPRPPTWPSPTAWAIADRMTASQFRPRSPTRAFRPCGIRRPLTV